MEGVQLEENIEKHTELLGIKVQCNLKWSSQIEKLVRKLQTRLNGLEKIKFAMNKEKKKILWKEFSIVYCAIACPCLEAATRLKSKRSKSSKAEQLS